MKDQRKFRSICKQHKNFTENEKVNILSALQGLTELSWKTLDINDVEKEKRTILKEAEGKTMTEQEQPVETGKDIKL